jgi:hypothetical protein
MVQSKLKNFEINVFFYFVFAGGSHSLPNPVCGIMSNPTTVAVASTLAASAPYLLKQLTTPTIMTVSPSNQLAADDDGGVPRKRLKLDIEAACSTNNSSSNSKPNNTRRRLLEKRLARQARITESYKDNMSELFFLQSKGNVVDLQAFRKRPSQQYLNFLKSNNAPEEVMGEVRLSVLGPNAVADHKAAQLLTVSSTTGRVTVTSAAMAAAVVAAHGSNWRPKTASSDLSSSTTTTSIGGSRPPPYSPRSNLLSPVKYGDQLTPYTSSTAAASATLASTRTTSYATYRLPTYSRDQVVEKLRQEAWVTRRINDLAREGLWSDRRLPKVCERPRLRTHWDGVLSEMQWLAVDFHEERQWKRSAAKMLAYSAKAYVEQLADRRAKVAAAREKRHRKIAKFMAGQVLLFWNSIFINTENAASLTSPSYLNNSRVKFSLNEEVTKNSELLLFGGEASSESGVCNLDDDDEEEYVSDIFEEDGDLIEFLSEDDESTIEEQEAFEAANKAGLDDEVVVLEEDNSKPIDAVLASAFPGYDLSNCSVIDEEQHDSSISSADENEADSDEDDDDDEEEEYLFSDSERVINLPLSNKQRKLYDDYLSSSSSRSALDNGEAKGIAAVLQTLRKICNHPQLVEDDIMVPDTDESFATPRLADDLRIPSLVAKAREHDPWINFDLAALNFVFFTHESSLTAITYDRVRKCCAPKALIEELPSQTSELTVPTVPAARLELDLEIYDSIINSRPLQQQPRTTRRNSSTTDQAFHKDSLNVIARFNERRCNGMPLYGQDLIEVLTIVSSEADCLPPNMATSTVWKGSGFTPPTQQQTTLESLPNNLATPFWPFFAAAKQRPSKTSRSRWLRTTSATNTSNHLAHIHSDYNRLVDGLHLVPKVQLVAGWNPNVAALTAKHFPFMEAVKVARRNAAQHLPPLPSSSPFTSLVASVKHKKLRQMSSKLTKLDSMLQGFRRNGERALVFCEMPEMLAMLAIFMHSHHYPFIFLDPEAGLKERLQLIEEFSTRSHFLVLLSSPQASHLVNNLRKFNGHANIRNVVFFDSNINNNNHHTTSVDSLEWCRSFNGLNQLNVFKLVCEDTVEDSLSIKALLQQKIMLNNRCNNVAADFDDNNRTNNGPLSKVKKRTLEALFNPHFGDNGVLSGDGNAGNVRILKIIHTKSSFIIKQKTLRHTCESTSIMNGAAAFFYLYGFH